MADNLSKQPIYVETDYDNIVLIDPNKIVVNNKVDNITVFINFIFSPGFESNFKVSRHH